MPPSANYVKLHKDCGGTVKWVENIRKKGEGYYGKCLLCECELPEEDIIKIERDRLQEPHVIEWERSYDKFDLEWNYDQSWEENQERLAEEIQQQVYG